MNEWISVKDRLPELFDQILFTDGIKTYYGEKWEGYYLTPIEYQEDSYSIPEDKIIKWMPLPEPPK